MTGIYRPRFSGSWPLASITAAEQQMTVGYHKAGMQKRECSMV
jgi:hypothetical protein